MGYADAAAYVFGDAKQVGRLRALVCRKLIPHIRLGKRIVVFESADLDAYLASKRVEIGGGE
ncbi:MAG: hypothetical protein KF773_26415 [Deltaproteobacteria bacterium]|nr:hypothetical protein [Deltaproteobacteria bacterium]